MNAQTVIIGAGHNGLTTAFYLAKAGLKPLVLERRDIVGGAAVTETFAPGFQSPLAHTTGPVRASVVRDLQLARRVTFVQPDPRLIALTADGRALSFSTDLAKTQQAIRAFSEADAAKYADFTAALRRLAAYLAAITEMPPPSLGEPAA